MTDIISLRNATSIATRFVDNGDGTYSEQVAVTGGVAAPIAARAGASVSGSVGAASATIIAAGTFRSEVTLQNTHASQTLSISFTSPATAADFTIQPGAALTVHFGPTNALYGIGSGAATTFAAIGA